MSIKKKLEKEVAKARIYITATFNNTLIAVTDQEGNVFCRSSAGESGFSGARRATPFAARLAITNVLERLKKFNTRELEVYLKGPGAGREASLRSLKASPFKLTLIADTTPIPHNGVRAKKRRRV